MSDLIRRMDAVQACQVGPSDEWSRDTKSGYNQAATDCAMNILRVPAVQPEDRIEALTAEHNATLARLAGAVAREIALTAERDSLLSGHRILNIDGARLQARAEKAEADNARLRADLGPLMRYVPHSVVECRGDKCREPWCVSCFGEDDAIVGLARAQAYAAAARAALNTGKEPSHE